MKSKVYVFIIMMFLFTGCAELMNILQTTGTAVLTEAYEINGLKVAPILQNLFGSLDNKVN